MSDDKPIPHEWARDDEGAIANFEYGDYHDGPQCVRCMEIFCRNCDEKEMKEPCPDQTPMSDDKPIPHEWARDDEGAIANFEYGDYHDGPQCVRCMEIFCRNCDEKEMKEPCPDQTPMSDDKPIPHEWARDDEGAIANFEYGDYHDGPQCVRCMEIFCRNCDEKEMKEPCPDQTPALFEAYPDRPRVVPGPDSRRRKADIAYRRSLPGGPNYVSR